MPPFYSEPNPTGKPWLYLSGTPNAGSRTLQTKESYNFVRRAKTKRWCFSFAYNCEGTFAYRGPHFYNLEKKYTDQWGVRVMMDSSAHTFHNFVKKAMHKMRGGKRASQYSHNSVEEYREQTIECYKKYIRENHKRWDFYANFDYVQHAPTVYKMQRMFEKEGLKVTPVFHGDSGMDWFYRYVDDGHKFMCIGMMFALRQTWAQKRFYLDKVFEAAEKHNVKLHGFAVTSVSLGTMYPWYSVDSSTWMKCAANGCIVVMDPVWHTTSVVHVSKKFAETKKKMCYAYMDSTAQKYIRETVEGAGFDFDLVREHYWERAQYCAWYLNKFFHEIKAQPGEADRIRWQKVL